MGRWRHAWLWNRWALRDVRRQRIQVRSIALLLALGACFWIINTNMPETMPDVGMLASVTPVTDALAVVPGTLLVAAAPLLTLRRLQRTDVPSTLRVVE